MPAKQEDALAADKPSFNRGPDGRTSFRVPAFRTDMDNLLQESMQRSGGGEYMMASKAFSQIATVRENEMTHRKDTETKRQGSERGKLEESYRIESERFEVEWAQKMKAVEERCRLRLVELKELQEIHTENLERDIAHKVREMRYNNSSYLLGLEDIERRLALAKEFNGAHEMAAKARKQRKMEEEAHQKKVDAQGAQPRAALKVAQIEEERNITQKCHGWRVEARRQQARRSRCSSKSSETWRRTSATPSPSSSTSKRRSAPCRRTRAGARRPRRSAARSSGSRWSAPNSTSRTSLGCRDSRGESS